VPFAANGGLSYMLSDRGGHSETAAVKEAELSQIA